MYDIIEKIIEDISDRENGVIRFRVRCGVCGGEWVSEPARFTKAGNPANNKITRVIHNAMWKREQAAARKKAVKEAAAQFNLCPICHGISCNKCFRICDCSDMCADCMERLGEHGRPVEPDDGS